MIRKYLLFSLLVLIVTLAFSLIACNELLPGYNETFVAYRISGGFPM